MRYQPITSRGRQGTPFGGLVFFFCPLGPAFAVVILALLTGGCHDNYAIPPQKPSADVPDPGLRVTLQTAPTVVRQMDQTTFTFRLSDARGHAVDGAGVTAELIMPTMEMGANNVSVRPRGAGLYVGTGRFSMGGDWRVIVTASKGSRKSITTFAVRVR